MSRRIAYLHGFGSSPDSKKGLFFSERFLEQGIELVRPDLNRPNFARLSYGAMLKAVDELVGSDGPWSFIGSSLGGYLAALFAARHPDRVERLLLLCPGFRLVERWPAILGPKAMKKWSAQGALPFIDARGQEVPLSYQFFEEAQGFPREPAVVCPTVIVHGRRDEVVPLEFSRRYADSHSNVRLVEVDDDHALMSSQELLWKEAVGLLCDENGPQGRP